MKKITKLFKNTTAKILGYIDDNKESWINDYLAKSDTFANLNCPNIYVVSNGTVGANGEVRDYNKTMQILKQLGVKQVSLLASIAALENGKFKLGTNVSYTDVVDVIHAAGITIKSVRFSNSVYGKDKMCSSEALSQLAASVPELVSELGIESEIDFVGILNETSQCYFDSSLTNYVVSCINSIQESGYKVAITDNARYCMQIPKDILSSLDYIGFNEYPIAYVHDITTATIDKIYDGISSYQTELYARIMQSKGLKVFISEFGCSNRSKSLIMPSNGGDGDYVGMTYIVKYIAAWKRYIINSGMAEFIESVNPWYTDIWENNEELSMLLGGVK